MLVCKFCSIASLFIACEGIINTLEDSPSSLMSPSVPPREFCATHLYDLKSFGPTFLIDLQHHVLVVAVVGVYRLVLITCNRMVIA